jgi:hypothetical protein
MKEGAFEDDQPSGCCDEAKPLTTDWFDSFLFFDSTIVRENW